jgi:hypothetical protein
VDGLSWRSLLYIGAGVVAFVALLVGGAKALDRFFTDYREDVTRWEPKGVSDDGRTITVEYTTSRCNYDQFDRVERVETASTVTLTVILRNRLERGDCEDIAIYHEKDVELDRPLGDRRLIDGRTGSTPSFNAHDVARVEVRQIVDVLRGSYIDGFQSYVRIEQASDYGRLLEQRLPDGVSADARTLVSTLSLRLRPDEYRLVSFQRPCQGTCESLDLPTDKCTALIEPSPLHPVGVTVTVRPGEGCRIEVE